MVVAGLSTYASLPREAAPDIPIPFVIVTTIYVGASPTDVEHLVTREIETELQGLENVKEMRSTSAEGVSTITIEFNPDESIDDALQRVKDKVDLAQQDLPDDAEESIVSEVNFSNFPIMIVNLSAPYGLVRLKEVAEDLQDAIEGIPGVLEARLAGGLEREVKVDVDPDRLTGYGLSLQDVVDAIQRENVTLPGGSLEMGDFKYSVRVPGEVDDPEVIADLVIKATGQQPVYVRDVAEVTFGFKERQTLARLNGQSCVSLSVIKRTGENLIGISDRVKALLDEFPFPPGTQTAVQADQSEDIRVMVADLENNILSGLILVVGVLYFFMGARNALFAGVAIPLSMLVAFVVLSVLDITLNMVVLFGLILALGMLVDNAIVIVENIFRHRQEGRSAEEGASVGTHEVGIAVIASTLTTLCAFAPMIFWPGIMGEFMKYLPITLIITLSASLFVGLVMNPTFCSAFMKSLPPARSEETSRFRKALNRYQAFLVYALDRPGRTLALSGGSLVGVIVLYGALGHGVEFFPRVDPNKAYVDVRAPSGTKLAVSDSLVRRIEQVVAGIPEVETYVSTVGSSSDPIDFGSGAGAPHKSRVTLDFIDEELRTRSGFAVIDEIRGKLSGIAGAEIEISEERAGPPTGPPVAVEIAGEDFDVLGQLAARVKRIVAGVPGVVDVQDDYDRGRPEIRVVVDRRSSALAGVDTRLIASTVRTAVYGNDQSEYRVGEDAYDIRVRLRDENRRSLSDLEQLMIEKDGKLVPLGTIARVETGAGFGSIQRVDLDRVVTVSGKVVGRTTDAALTDVQAALSDMDLPGGYQLRYSGENEEQEKAAAFLSRAFVIAVFLITMVLVSQFDSVLLPAVVMVSVILSLIGVMIGLIVTATPFGILMTGVGVISLAGVVVNNAIVLIDYVLKRRAWGDGPREAIVNAATTRFRPVVMTAVTTILGLLPLTTGISFDFFTFSWEIGGRSSQWWGPMGVAVVFGLTFATVLTLVVVPVMVDLIWRWRGAPSVEAAEAAAAK